MKKTIILNTLLAIGILNVLTLLYFAFTAPSAYTIANVDGRYLEFILVYIPLVLTIISVFFFLFDLLVYKEKNWYIFFIAFFAILADAIFIVGSQFFGGH